jgi:hypothetical protein
MSKTEVVWLIWHQTKQERHTARIESGGIVHVVHTPSSPSPPPPSKMRDLLEHRRCYYKESAG